MALIAGACLAAASGGHVTTAGQLFAGDEPAKKAQAAPDSKPDDKTGKKNDDGKVEDQPPAEVGGIVDVTYGLRGLE